MQLVARQTSSWPSAAQTLGPRRRGPKKRVRGAEEHGRRVAGVCRQLSSLNLVLRGPSSLAEDEKYNAAQLS